MDYRAEHNITGNPAGNQTNHQMKNTIANETETTNENVYDQWTLKHGWEHEQIFTLL